MALKFRIAIALAGMLAALSASASIADAGKGKGKPDLVPTAGKLDGKPFSLIGERLGVSVDDVTANRGERRAGPTLTRVFLRRGKARDELADRAVGGLRPGKSDRGTSDARGRNQFKPGRYAVVVCVDATDQEREENEKNNCGRLDDFYSTYREWEGSLNGIGPGLSFSTTTTTETWRTSTPISFEFAGYDGNGQFEWRRSGGALTYTHQGSFIGCSQSGSSTFVLDPASVVEVNYDRDRFTAVAQVISGATYPIRAVCPTGTFLVGFGPLHKSVLSIAPPGEPVPFGSTRLSGAGASPITPGVTYSWNLAGVG